MSAAIRRYVASREDFEFDRGFNEKQLQASELRQSFLKRYIIGFDTNLYKTQEERDWSYIAKREYNYDVLLKGAGLSWMIGNSIFIWRVFVNKRFVIWPIAIVPVAFLFIQPVLLQKHSKKLFDMCNLGENFFLGQKRNEVLRECNKILDVEDF